MHKWVNCILSRVSIDYKTTRLSNCWRVAQLQALDFILIVMGVAVSLELFFKARMRPSSVNFHHEQ